MASTIKFSPQLNILPVELPYGEIKINLSDETFLKKLLTFAETLAKESEILSNVNDEASIIDADVSYHERVKDEFTKLFGEGSYEKAFGEDVLIGAEYVLDFIDLLLPHIQKNTENRARKINKYNANRVGSSI